MKIKICTGKTCSDRFSDYIITRLKNDKERFNLKTLEIEETLCMGKCSVGPNIVVDGDTKNYINPAKASEFAFGKTQKPKKNNKANNKTNNKK